MDCWFGRLRVPSRFFGSGAWFSLRVLRCTIKHTRWLVVLLVRVLCGICTSPSTAYGRTKKAHIALSHLSSVISNENWWAKSELKWTDWAYSSSQEFWPADQSRRCHLAPCPAHHLFVTCNKYYWGIMWLLASLSPPCIATFATTKDIWLVLTTPSTEKLNAFIHNLILEPWVIPALKCK